MRETSFVSGQTAARAAALLVIAADLGYPIREVRAVAGGFMVPSDVAETYAKPKASKPRKPKVE